MIQCLRGVAIAGQDVEIQEGAGMAKIPTDTFPSLTEHGAAWHERHVVSGFFFSSSGIGLVGRFSGRPVVNVSQGGGLIPALWVH